jgi:glycosyltransferase involved in cell wall biosynthesis
MSNNFNSSKVLILAFGDISRDPRVMRQIIWLRGRYDITVAGFAPPSDRSINFIDISKKEDAPQSLDSDNQRSFRLIRSYIIRLPFVLFLRKKAKEFLNCFLRYSVTEKLKKSNSEEVINGHLRHFISKFRATCSGLELTAKRYDLIIANDLDCLVFAKLTFPVTPVAFDAHEYAPLEYDYDADWWVKFEKPAREWACREFLPQVSGMSTVCDGIASAFKRNFSVHVQINVITNAPSYHELPICSTGERIKIVHHGLGSPLRKIECMIEAVKLLGDKYELYLILVDGDRNYINGLRDQYNCCDNIYFLDPVAMLDIVNYISNFDIGMFILEPKIFNYKFALPNKFFEFIQARLALAVGPSPEMSRIVKQHNIGVVASDFTPEAMATALSRLSVSQIDQYKRNSGSCAHFYCSERNRDIMIDIVDTALSDSRLAAKN